VETKFFIQAFSFNLVSFVKIYNLPSLVLTTSSLVDGSLLVLKVFVSIDFNNLLVVDIGEEALIVNEDLPPIGVGAVYLEFIRFSRALDIE
jgi:hypothetical protein